MQFDYPIVSFESGEQFFAWLSQNSEKENGVWIRLFKKNSGVRSVTHQEALLEALCFGWIDGQSKSFDDQSWLQKFTPRRTKSLWSKRNIELVEQLIKAGKMQKGGLREIERAKEDGRWEAAYDKASEMEVPKEFLAELSKDKKALEFFEGLNKANKYAIGWRLQTAKTEATKARRMELILSMMRKGEKIH